MTLEEVPAHTPRTRGGHGLSSRTVSQGRPQHPGGPDCRTQCSSDRVGQHVTDHVHRLGWVTTPVAQLDRAAPPPHRFPVKGGGGGGTFPSFEKVGHTWRFDSSQSLGFCSARDQLTTPKRLKTGYHPSVLKTRLQVIPYHQWVHRAASLSRSPRPGARQLSLRRRPPTGGVDQAGGLLPLPRPPEWPGLLPNRNVDHSTTWAQPPPSLLTPRKATSPLRERIGRGWGQNRSSPCVRHRRMTHLQQPVPTGNTGGGRRALPTRPAAVGLSLPLSEPWLRAPTWCPHPLPLCASPPSGLNVSAEPSPAAPPPRHVRSQP